MAFAIYASVMCYRLSRLFYKIVGQICLCGNILLIRCIVYYCVLLGQIFGNLVLCLSSGTAGQDQKTIYNILNINALYLSRFV